MYVWAKGGGLKEGGIEEPITPSGQVTKAGLGARRKAKRAVRRPRRIVTMGEEGGGATLGEVVA